MLALIQDHFPDHRATANGVYMFLSLLLRSAGIMLVGIAGDYLGLSQAFFWGAIIAFFVFPAVWMLPTESKAELA